MRSKITVRAAAFPAAFVLLVSGWLAAPGMTTAAAATCGPWSASQEPPNPGPHPDVLNGVTVLSAANAWTVGSYYNGQVDQNLIVHWNGSMWKVVPSPDVGGSSHENFLLGVYAISAHNIWAVGSHNNGTADRTLTMHWNGLDWKVVPSANLGGSASENFLEGVSAASASDVWAVGKHDDGLGFQTVIEHWDGTSWSKVASPDPGGPGVNNELTGVTALSATDAWAVGFYVKGGAYRTLILHWAGSTWTAVSSPNANTPGNDNFLQAVAATSDNDIWAVGNVSDGTTERTLIEHRTGSQWAVVPSPNPATGTGDIDGLLGVTATSTGNAWAVGFYAHAIDRTLIVHWNGANWATVPSPNLGGRASESVLTGVDASGSCSAWAVGFYDSPTVPAKTLALHWS
jgi:hypothetical protein